MEEQEGTLYAVSAKVPVCAIWNLLDDKSEEQLPLMTIVEWLNFTQGRSQVDQQRTGRATSSSELRRGADRKLEVSVRGLDAARRSGHKDRIMLMEFQTQSRDLQAEMREDIERLQEQLTDSESQVVDLKADLAVEQLAEATRRINALQVEEVVLKDALGRSQAEEIRLYVEVANFRTKWMAAVVQGGVTEVSVDSPCDGEISK